MHRTHTCGELRLKDMGQTVTLSGWVNRSRDLGGLTFVDLRDRYGLTQIVFDMDADAELCKTARSLGREYVVKIVGKVSERSNKNPKLTTGDIEIVASELHILNASKTPPFTIEEESDGGDELRMKYRYLDLRRAPLQHNLILRHKTALQTRVHLSDKGFLEIETPYLIKSTPEGARDFVVPGTMNPGEFYALPQSPQTLKQLLMVAGYDRYFQIVKCFRDEDLRSDRQPEFTQIDCEMAFVERQDILETFEGLTRHLFREVIKVELPPFPRMDYETAMALFGTDKPDTRFAMEITDLTQLAQGQGFKVFDTAETVLAIAVKGAAEYSRKQLDALTEWVKRPQIGAKGMVYVKYSEGGDLKSSVDKFFQPKQLEEWCRRCRAQPGDLLLLLSGDLSATRRQLGELRLHVADQLGLRRKGEFAPLWVVDFPMFEWDEDSKRHHAMHHPFTSPMMDDLDKLDSNPRDVRANAYDLVINGSEIGGGSIRIHDRSMQKKVFDLLGFTPEEAQKQFGFLMDALEYGAPPHGGIAYGLDRLCAVMGGSESIRDYIAFPKNNAGRDVMMDAPAPLSSQQLEELGLIVKKKNTE